MEAADLTGPEFWISDTAVMMTAANEPSLAVPPLPEAAGLIFFRTSGSTGTPKWIGHTRASLLVSAGAVNGHLHVDAASCWGLALPVHHVGGFGVMSRTWRAGCRVAVFPERWNAVSFATWLAEEKVSHLSLVPTQVHDLVAAGCRGPASLKAVVVGGGVLPVATGRAARELGWPVLPSYGMTETASQIATRRIELLHLPYDASPIDLIEPWQVSLAEDSRLCVNGPSLFSGMLFEREGEWNYEKRSRGPFMTSDLASILGGKLTILGRADSIVKILGELVDPLAVEAELLALCGAAPGALVVATPDDPRSGKALVLVHEPAISADVLAAAVAIYHATAPGFRRISRILEIPVIPRSPLGKVLRSEISHHI